MRARQKIDNPEKVKGMAEGGVLWGGGMAGVNVKRKGCDCVGHFNLSRVLIEEDEKIKSKNGLECVSERF